MAPLDFWADLADQFAAIETNPTRFSAVWTAEGDNGTTWRLGGSLDAKVRFQALSELAIAKISGTADAGAYVAWLDRIIQELAVQRRIFADMVTRLDPITNQHQSAPPIEGLAGINHLAATLCRKYHIADQASRVSRPSDRRQSTFPDRAKWLAALLKKKKWTAHYFAGQAAVDHKTIDRIIAGAGVQDGVLQKIADFIKCDVRDIPST